MFLPLKKYKSAGLQAGENAAGSLERHTSVFERESDLNTI